MNPVPRPLALRIPILRGLLAAGVVLGIGATAEALSSNENEGERDGAVEIFNPARFSPVPHRVETARAQDHPGLLDMFRDGLPVPKPAPAEPPSVIEPEGNVGYGPLRFRTQAPFQALRLGILPAPPAPLLRGQWELRETADWSRLWGLTEQYLISLDTWSSGHSVAYGVTDQFQIEVGAVDTGWSGGPLDGFVRNFHDVFGLDQEGRNTVREGSFAFRVEARDQGPGVELKEEPRETVAEQLFLSIHQVVTGGSELLPAIGTSLTVKSNLKASPYIEGDGIDLAASISLSKRWGDLYGYLTVGLAWYGEEEFLGLGLKPFGSSVLAAVEWNLSEKVSLVLQHQWVQGAVKNLGAHSRPSYEIALGAKIRIGPASLLEIGLLENIVIFDNSPDFGIHCGVTIRL